MGGRTLLRNCPEARTPCGGLCIPQAAEQPKPHVDIKPGGIEFVAALYAVAVIEFRTNMHLNVRVATRSHVRLVETF
jgi:hypothetical protein